MDNIEQKLKDNKMEQSTLKDVEKIIKKQVQYGPVPSSIKSLFNEISDKKEQLKKQEKQLKININGIKKVVAKLNK
jgi:hypothetical protein